MQKLQFYQELILVLYIELYHKKYDISDIEKNKILKRHAEVQSLLYLVQNITLDEEFCFTSNCYGPYSPKLEALLNEMDYMTNEINDFNLKYIKKRNQYSHLNYNECLQYVLNKYLNKNDINRLTKFFLLFEDIANEENIMQYAACLAYTEITALPGCNFTEAVKYLEEHNYNSNNIAKTIWKYLQILDIINTKSPKIKTLSQK